MGNAWMIMHPHFQGYWSWKGGGFEMMRPAAHVALAPETPAKALGAFSPAMCALSEAFSALNVDGLALAELLGLAARYTAPRRPTAMAKKLRRLAKDAAVLVPREGPSAILMPSAERRWYDRRRLQMAIFDAQKGRHACR